MWIRSCRIEAARRVWVRAVVPDCEVGWQQPEIFQNSAASLSLVTLKKKLPARPLLISVLIHSYRITDIRYILFYKWKKEVFVYYSYFFLILITVITHFQASITDQFPAEPSHTSLEFYLPQKVIWTPLFINNYYSECQIFIRITRITIKSIKYQFPTLTYWIRFHG